MALPAPTSSCFRLTAFVLKSFAQARSFIFIDPQELAAAKGWIVQQQRADGSFPAVGRILNKDIQVGSLPASSWGLGLALAAPRCCLGPVGAGGCPLRLGMKPTNPLTGWDPRHSPADSLRGGRAPGDGPGLGGKRRGPGRCRAGGASGQFPPVGQVGHLLAIFSFCLFLAAPLLLINETF